MTSQANILAFPASKVLPVGRRDRGDSVPEAPRLSRPRLLVAAARHGQNGYRRARDLRRLMQGVEDVPPPGRALAWLTAREGQMDEARRAGLPDWDLQTHVLLLIALLAEMRLAREAAAPAAMPTAMPAAARARAVAGMRMLRLSAL